MSVAPNEEVRAQSRRDGATNGDDVSVASLKAHHTQLSAERAALLATLANAQMGTSSGGAGLRVAYDAEDVLRLRDCWKALQQEPDAENRRVIVREVEGRLSARIEEERLREQRLRQALHNLRRENARIRATVEAQHAALQAAGRGDRGGAQHRPPNGS